ncbi:MAG TPA: acyl-CoA dehydrogenase family protein, partial [Chitinophaga sp.]
MNTFSKIKQAIHLFKSIDLEQLGKLSQKVDLPQLMATVGKMDEAQLNGLVKMLGGGAHAKKPQPAINGDFYDLGAALPPEDSALQLKVRAFMEKEIQPIANHYWNKAAFPFEIIPKLAELNICGVTYEGYGCPHRSFIMEGIIAMEIARVDASIATFFGVQSGLAMGSIYLLGTDAQKQEWLPGMQQLKTIGAFGLTEPEVGSGAAGGLTTTATRHGDTWTLQGRKKWIGNAPFADVLVIWARDTADNQVKGFLLRKGTPGCSVEKMEDKMALRIVQNGLITLRDCQVPEADRLQNAHSFKDTAKVLRMTRAGVAWQAVGCARGAYENALA